jgi:fibronectin-binding autotransporter adhesin
MIRRNNISPSSNTKSKSLFKRIVLLCIVLLMMSAEYLTAQVISTNGTVFINNTSGTVIVTNTVESNTGSTFTNDGAIELTGNWTNGGAYSSTSGTVNYLGSGPQNVAGLNYIHLMLSTSGTKTLSASANVAGNLTLSGTAALVDGGFQIIGNGIGALSMTAGNTLTLGTAGTATLFPTNFTNGNISLTAGSTVIYNSDQAQTISGTPTYRNLTLNATSPVTKTLNAATTINGNLKINANNTLVDGGFQIIGNASGTLSIVNGATLKLGSAATATTFPTNFITANITLSATSTVVYNSDQAQTISAVPTYGHLTLTSTASVTKTISTVLTAAGDITVNTNNILDITGTGDVTLGGNFNLFGGLTNSGILTIGP